MADQKINTYAWARILDDASPIAAMDDAEFAEFWAGLGRAMRIACLAAGRQDGQRQPEPPIVISGQDWAVTSTLSRDEVIDRLAQAGAALWARQDRQRHPGGSR